ncbi:enoyl-CoA hydratase/isomerase family protein [Membranicola marinus]|uniref:Enoyl-CoA hydratase/isomerase family protein n=1 Tax=Membranihabitans marinus TaxID=1227546 RepID=A0A953L5Y6_9BACT|nr:enoyl-CoA hydratase-related protein [Membranihabitans marinus]MBY5957087.1 enoyl-CoA hydratase/isomerase family protein [Membranihabitans marinus]
MEYKYLDNRIESNILIIRLSREDHLNALNHEMVAELRQLFEELKSNEKGYKGVVITGSGSKAFAAGADIKELMTLNVDDAYMISKDGHTTFNLIEECSIPVIAAINGYALGGGFELALACHIRVADTVAQMGLPESTLGLIPGYGGTQRLPRIIGRAKAIELMCSGEMIHATYAKELGIVSYVTTPGFEVQKSIEVIKKMTKNAPTSVGKILKATLDHEQAEDGFRYEREAFAKLLQSDNAKEGMTAFIEKRKPEFE